MLHSILALGIRKLLAPRVKLWTIKFFPNFVPESTPSGTVPRSAPGNVEKETKHQCLCLLFFMSFLSSAPFLPCSLEIAASLTRDRLQSSWCLLIYCYFAF